MILDKYHMRQFKSVSYENDSLHFLDFGVSGVSDFSFVSVGRNTEGGIILPA